MSKKSGRKSIFYQVISRFWVKRRAATAVKAVGKNIAGFLIRITTCSKELNGCR
ncbi:hypothetical protein [Zobellella denitrificans]|uniref:hypothetical protein n=1 Tax=Zobellella denitrificans TaxID=347534 RepID=UPI00159628B1|nr:hypothetical protein [Zobellella denitrificans]